MGARLYFGVLVAAVMAVPASAVDLGFYDPQFSGGSGMPPHGGKTVAAESVDGTLRLRASLGATYLEGNEFV